MVACQEWAKFRTSGSPPAIVARLPVVRCQRGVVAPAASDTDPPLGLCDRFRCLRRKESPPQSIVEPSVPLTLPLPSTKRFCAQLTVRVRLSPSLAAVAPLHANLPPTLGGETTPGGAVVTPHLLPLCGPQALHLVDVEGCSVCHASETAARLAGEREGAAQLQLLEERDRAATPALLEQ